MNAEEAVRDLHRKVEEEVLPWGCFEGNCDHDPTVECPPQKQSFCAEEISVADDCGYDAYPGSASWPCATIKALDDVCKPRASR